MTDKRPSDTSPAQGSTPGLVIALLLICVVLGAVVIVLERSRPLVTARVADRPVAVSPSQAGPSAPAGAQEADARVAEGGRERPASAIARVQLEPPRTPRPGAPAVRGAASNAPNARVKRQAVAAARRVPEPALKSDAEHAPREPEIAVAEVTAAARTGEGAISAPAPGTTVFARESAALAEVLGHYQRAYQTLDAAAAAAVWPTVDKRGLTRAFARLRMQDLRFGECTFAIAENEGTARCDGVLRYAQRIGDSRPRVEPHVWTIEFMRSGEVWKIARMTAQ